MDFELSDSQKEIRAAVAALCARFGNEYWRRCDVHNAYPDEFVKTLSEAGWLSALIPQEYGGAGLGMVEASLILEEINRSGGNAVACHAQMYTMASILKHGSAASETAVSAAHRLGRTAAAIFRHYRAGRRFRNPTHQDLRAPRGRSLRRQRPENLHLALPAFGYAAAADAHHALRSDVPKRPMA